MYSVMVLINSIIVLTNIIIQQAEKSKAGGAPSEKGVPDKPKAGTVSAGGAPAKKSGGWADLDVFKGRP